MFSYIAYGLGIHSVFPLPELIAKNVKSDVLIKREKLTPFLSEVVFKGDDFQITPNGVFLFWKNEGNFLIRDGQEIIIDPASGVDERIIRLLTLGPALAVLLHQRGRLALHAATVEVNGSAVAFMGNTGCGKSTLAVALYFNGHGLVADDVTAIQSERGNNPVVFPGFPQLKLWPEVIASLGHNPKKLPYLEPGIEKRSLLITSRFSKKPLNLKKIYLLNGEQPKEIIPLKPQEALMELLRHSYRASLLKGAQESLLFSQCASLANHIPMSRLNRPLSLSSLPSVVRMIEEDLAHA